LYLLGDGDKNGKGEGNNSVSEGRGVVGMWVVLGPAVVGDEGACGDRQSNKELENEDGDKSKREEAETILLCLAGELENGEDAEISGKER
jgi:hypothetical protein